MPIYTVDLGAPFTNVVLEASSLRDAREIADRSDEGSHVVTETPNARPNAWVCEHCLMMSRKDDWGPGRVTCPRCGKTAPTAEESMLLVRKRWKNESISVRRADLQWLLQIVPSYRGYDWYDRLIAAVGKEP